VLVVDDDPLFVDCVVSLLCSEGFDAEGTTEASDAADRVLQGRRFDVLLSDVTMAPLDGVELHDRVCAVDAGQAARMVFLTGGVADPAVRARLRALPNRCLPKPVTSTELAGMLRVLDGATGGDAGRSRSA
jgi:CheY-like chemotaxis protein